MTCCSEDRVVTQIQSRADRKYGEYQASQDEQGEMLPRMRDGEDWVSTLSEVGIYNACLPCAGGLLPFSRLPAQAYYVSHVCTEKEISGQCALLLAGRAAQVTSRLEQVSIR